jgi:hypothetical protein
LQSQPPENCTCVKAYYFHEYEFMIFS